MKDKPKNIFVQGAITPEQIAESVRKHSSRTEIGAHSIFLGQVRADEKTEGVVTSIEYSAYEEMALEKAQEIREQFFRKYPLTCMHIFHSLGNVKVGEICLFVFTSSKHRQAAIDACNDLVDRIKTDLPVWGKEKTDSDFVSWKVNS
jgi:molybdopterin synthase catalytic subunit